MTQLLIPMAGEGKRFKDAGYSISKPCIEIDNIPMVVQAVRSLPKSDCHIFVVRDFHMMNGVVDTIRHFYPKALFKPISQLTDGQASTCLLAKQEIDNNDPLMIGACDNGMVWSKSKFESLKQEADCIVWTFRNNPCVTEHPEHYGWIKTERNGLTITQTSIKKPLSDTPKNDHAIVGAFWFAKGHYFVEAAEAMITDNNRINNEFYVDTCIDYIIKSGKKAVVFEIDYYIGWGTPADLQTWIYWSEFFKKEQLI